MSQPWPVWLDELLDKPRSENFRVRRCQRVLVYQPGRHGLSGVMTAFKHQSEGPLLYTEEKQKVYVGFEENCSNK